MAIDIRKEASIITQTIKIGRKKQVRQLSDFEAQIDPQTYLFQNEERDRINEEKIKEALEKKSIENNVTGIEDYLVETVNWENYDVTKIVNVLTVLAEKLSGIILFEYQKSFMRRIFRAILTNEGCVLTGLMSRQSGKSQSTACAVATLCVAIPALAKIFPTQLAPYARGFWVGIYAPSDEQADTIYQKIRTIGGSKEAQEVYKDPDFGTNFKKFGCAWENGSFVYRQSADVRSKLESKTWHLCVSEDTEVSLPEGKKKIKDLREGENILSWNESTNTIEKDKIEKIWCSGEKQIFRVTTKDGQSIETTAAHKFATNHGWLTLEEIQEKGIKKVLIYDTENKRNGFRIVTRRFIHSENFKNQSAHKSEPLNNTNKLRKRKTFLFSPLCQDTSENKTQRRKRSSALRILHNFYRRNKRNLGYLLLKQWKEKSYIRVGREVNSFIAGLLVYGRRLFTKQRYLPYKHTFFFGRRAVNSIKAFIRVWNTREIKRRQKNIQKIYNFLCPRERQIFEFDSSVYTRQYALQMSNNREKTNMCNMQGTFPSFFEKSKMLLHRLLEKAQIKLRCLFNKNRLQKSSFFSILQKKATPCFSLIESITPVGIKRTYDVTVTKNHNFIGNNFIVHNCIIEEAQDMAEDVINQKILPMLAWTNGTSVMIGTVVPRVCRFKEQIDLNIKESDKRPPEERYHIEYDYKEVVKHNPRYARHVEQQIKMYGMESDYFKMSYALIWDLNNGSPISRKSLIAKSMYTKLGIVSYSDLPVIIGIDLAKSLNSSIVTVCGLTNARVEYEDGVFENISTLPILNWLEITGVDFIEQRPIMYDFIKRYPNTIRIVVDTTGAGTVVAEQMMVEWADIGCIFDLFAFNQKTKADLYAEFTEYFDKHMLLVPSDEAARSTKEWRRFMHQCSIAKKVEKAGYIYLEKPNNRERDDYLDSWLLAVHGFHQEIKSKQPIRSHAGNVYGKNGATKPELFSDIRERVNSGSYYKSAKRSRLSILMDDSTSLL